MIEIKNKSKWAGRVPNGNFLTVQSAGLPLTKSFTVIPKLGVSLLAHRFFWICDLELVWNLEFRIYLLFRACYL